MSVRENLIAAKALIDTPEKWGKPQNTFYSKGERPGSLIMSAMGAIYEVSKYPGSPGYEALYVALDGAVPEHFHLRPAVGPTRQYNDHPTTTHADIMALFDRAIAAAEPTP
jgi:hypothetical protein